MSQTELIFRGLDETECTSFIREVHKRAHEAGHLRDNAWMADIAMVAFDGRALKWFDEQGPEVQADWALLRRALIQKYSDDQFDPVPPAAIVNPRTMPIVPNAPVAAAVADPIVNPSFTLPAASTPRPESIQPSNQVRPYQESENPKLYIQVIAPKIPYTGFVSTTFTTDGFGYGCCTLTEELSEALECHNVDASGIIKTTTRVDAPDPYKQNFEPLTLQQTRSDWMSATLASFNRVLPDGNWSSGYETLSGDTASLGHWGENSRPFWNVDATGRLAPNSGAIKCPTVATIGKTPDGNLTLYFWQYRVWNEADDAYAAQLYFVRAN